VHVLASALGSAGDVHPFIAIGLALRARGHAVDLLASPRFGARIEGAGLGFVPLGAAGDYDRMVAQPELWHPSRGLKLVLDELAQRLPEAYALTAAQVRRDTVLVGSTLSWNVRLVQEALRVPAATVHLAPACIFSAIAPPRLPRIGDLSWCPAPLLRRLQAAGERWWVDPLVVPRLDALRATLGLPPVRRLLGQWQHSPGAVIAAWPDWFAPAQPDWPPHSATSGFPLWDEPGALDGTLEHFLATGDAPVGITPGSAMAHAERFFARALAACEALGHRAVLVTAYSSQLPQPLPAWAHHVPYAPFAALLPRLAALVHHGGIGTSARALAAGVPQLVLPFAHDQFDNAARLRKLGVARVLSQRASARRWRNALQVLLEAVDVVLAVRRVAERLRGHGAAAHGIASRIEALARQRG
jgi:rhamnosyltransferase subunit B